MNNMALLMVVSVLLASTANADQLTDQINAFEAVERQNETDARDLAKVQADYARQQNYVKQTVPRVNYSNTTKQYDARIIQNNIPNISPPRSVKFYGDQNKE